MPLSCSSLFAGARVDDEVLADYQSQLPGSRFCILGSISPNAIFHVALSHLRSVPTVLPPVTDEQDSEPAPQSENIADPALDVASPFVLVICCSSANSRNALHARIVMDADQYFAGAGGTAESIAHLQHLDMKFAASLCLSVEYLRISSLSDSARLPPISYF